VAGAFRLGCAAHRAAAGRLEARLDQILPYKLVAVQALGQARTLSQAYPA
jgi:hypothetical protein